MDHRISKDMISSGMIPSGEKNQEDLGKTQYGTVPSPNALSDVYKKMYETKEEVINEHHKKDADGNTIPHEDEEIKEGKMPAGLQAYLDKKKGKKEDKKEMKEEVDKFDVVFNHFISEGYSEKEAYAEMANLTEEQLDEFLKALAQAGMKGAQAIGKKTQGLAARAAQQGANLGQKKPMDVISPVKRKPFDAKPTPRKPFDAKKPEPKIGDDNFRAKTASDVVTSINMKRKKEREITPNKGQVMQDEYQHQIDEAPMLATAALGLVKKIATKQAVKKLAGNVATGAAMSAGSNLMSGGGGGGQQKPKTGTVSNSADLFDIVKGQLLDEGLSEEEIRDIMLTLTPDEIMSEMAVNPNIAAMDAKNKADMIARAQANKVPDKVREASKKQMKAGTPREDKNNPYTTQDKKTIIDYNKNK